MKCVLVVALFVLLVVEAAAGFQSSTEQYLARVGNNQYPNRGNSPSSSRSGAGSNDGGGGSVTPAADPSDQESRAAAILSDYLAKSHEEKLGAVADVEQTKNAEIRALRDEITELRRNVPASTSIVMTNNNSVNHKALEDMNKEELVNKVVLYQNWMRQYMVDAQEQKYRAVQAAEDAARKKWAEAMMLLPPAAAAANTGPAANQSPLYAARSAAVSMAGEAGKSRWGDMEVQRVTDQSFSTVTRQPKIFAVNGATAPAAPFHGVPLTSVPPPTAPVVPVPPEVAAADHGLRADGGVSGLSLAERVYFGAAAAAPLPASASTPGLATAAMHFESLYTQRNTKVVQAAKMQKARWGAQEVERVQNILTATATATTTTTTRDAVAVNNGATAPALPVHNTAAAAVSVPVPPEVAEADHGLRADGGVGGWTLAERVYLGATAAADTAPHLATSAVLATPSSSNVWYVQRNKKVLQAAKVDQSRWGPREVERVQTVVAAATPATTGSYRPAVNGASSLPPTSAVQINLGANIVAKK